MTAPAVSVIVAAYNAAAFIVAALTSVATQTLADHEVIVVDDASTDATAGIVEALARRDDRIRLVRQAANSGPSAARNLGMTLARGRWIAPLDADDAYAPGRLRRLVDAAEAQGATLCSDNLLLLREDSRTTGTTMIPPALLAAPRAMDVAEFHQRNVADPRWPDVNYGFLKPIMRRDFLEHEGLRYDERVRFGEDFAFYHDCFRCGATWWMMPEAGYHYRLRAGSLTHCQSYEDLTILADRLAAAEAAAAVARPELVPLIARHRRVVDRCRHYREFTDLLKSGRTGGARRKFLEHPRSALLIAEESLRQLPVITRKALRGGYARR